MMRPIVFRVFLILGLFLFLWSCGPGEDVDLEVTLYEDRVKGTGGGGLDKKGYHEVVSGDTLYGLSRRYKVPVRLLIRANTLQAPYTIKVGDKLKVPSKPVYEVKSGDTIHGIARRFGLSTRDVVVFNDIEPPYVIRVGQKLDLPSEVFEGVSGKGAEGSRELQVTTKSVSEGAVGLVQASPLTGSGFVWPVRGTLVKKFGRQKKGVFNSGVNVRVPKGTPVVASENGVVVYSSGGLRSLGNMVLVKHRGGYVSAYGHLGESKVKKGDKVLKGSVIGFVGTSGHVEKPQLHFQLRYGKKAVDPLKHLKA